jgi:hypothetical protein
MERVDAGKSMRLAVCRGTRSGVVCTYVVVIIVIVDVGVG